MGPVRVVCEKSLWALRRTVYRRPVGKKQAQLPSYPRTRGSDTILAKVRLFPNIFELLELLEVIEVLILAWKTCSNA
jgi:hypothetical protein